VHSHYLAECGFYYPQLHLCWWWHEHLSVTAFDTIGCAGTNLGSFAAGNFVGGFPGVPAVGWGELSAINQTLPGATQSVRIALDVFGPSDDRYVDDVRFGPTGTTPVRLQEFSVE